MFSAIYYHYPHIFIYVYVKCKKEASSVGKQEMHTVLYDRTVSSLLLRKNGFILYREKERKKKILVIIRQLVCDMLSRR